VPTDLIAHGLRAYERGLGSKKPEEQATAELCEPGRARAIASGARGLCGPGKPRKTCYRTCASGRRPGQVAAAAAPRVHWSRSAALIRLWAEDGRPVLAAGEPAAAFRFGRDVVELVVVVEG
jgi:hypothetical protein